MITISDVQDVLAEKKLDYPEERVSATLAAEKAHQRSVLDIPSPRPAEVDEALVARVLHNLATSGDEPTVRRVGWQSKDAQRLEARFRIRKSAEEKAEEPEPENEDAESDDDPS